MKPIPEHLKRHLGAYGPYICDGWCGEPIGWGYPVISHLGDDLWQEIQNYGELQCVPDPYRQSWYLIIKQLSRAEAEKKYGPITNEEWGPRGGWKSVTFGKKKFMSRTFKSERVK